MIQLCVTSSENMKAFMIVLEWTISIHDDFSVERQNVFDVPITAVFLLIPNANNFWLLKFYLLFNEMSWEFPFYFTRVNSRLCENDGCRKSMWVQHIDFCLTIWFVVYFTVIGILWFLPPFPSPFSFYGLLLDVDCLCVWCLDITFWRCFVYIYVVYWTMCI